MNNVKGYLTSDEIKIAMRQWMEANGKEIQEMHGGELDGELLISCHETVEFIDYLKKTMNPIDIRFIERLNEFRAFTIDTINKMGRGKQ